VLPHRAPWPRASSAPRAPWLSPPPPRVRRGRRLLFLIVCRGCRLYIYIYRERERVRRGAIPERGGRHRGRTYATAGCASLMSRHGRTRRRCARAAQTHHIGRTSRRRRTGCQPRVSAAGESQPSGAQSRIYVRESGESRPLEGAAPRRPPSAVRESGEDVACRHRSTVRESGRTSPTSARMRERETEKIMHVLVRCRVWG
jgi:hypothetical protein